MLTIEVGDDTLVTTLHHEAAAANHLTSLATINPKKDDEKKT